MNIVMWLNPEADMSTTYSQNGILVLKKQIDDLEPRVYKPLRFIWEYGG